MRRNTLLEQDQASLMTRLLNETRRKIEALDRANAANLRAIRRALSKEVKRESAELVVALALELLRMGHRFIACELVYAHKPALASLDIDLVEAFGEGLDSWHSVDIFCIYIAGPCWREGQISDQDIARWAAHESPWWRRSALVATTALTVRTRGGYGDSDRTLAVARLLVHDRHDLVVKALSWALRELVYWEPDRVEAFLEEFSDTLAPRVRREVRNKLDTGLKDP